MAPSPQCHRSLSYYCISTFILLLSLAHPITTNFRYPESTPPPTIYSHPTYPGENL